MYLRVSSFFSCNGYCTAGDFYGLGQTRKRELEKACAVLGVQKVRRECSRNTKLYYLLAVACKSESHLQCRVSYAVAADRQLSEPLALSACCRMAPGR